MHEMWAAQQAGQKSWNVPVLHVDGRAIPDTLETWSSRNSGRRDLQRTVDTNGEMFVLCRTSSGHTRVKCGRKLLNRCQPFLDETKKNRNPRNCG